MWKIHNEDAIKWANEYDGELFHALLSDPPYHLTSIVKRFGKNGSAPAQFGTDGVFSRSSKGFMGQQWDGGDVAFQPETWYAFSKVMYPGAFGMAFSASRNWHRLAVAIEDAGFIIHPSIFGWLQGQGFPKATNIHKQLLDFPEMEEIWGGHRYGLQALKPAVEPIIVFQKPYEGRPIDNIVTTGAGALNIDGGRIALAGDGDEYTINTFDDGAKPFGNGAGHKYTSRKVKEDKRLGGNGTWKTDKAAKNVYEGGYSGDDIGSSTLGRYPANFILDEELSERLGDESRFFFQVSNQIDEADPIYYTAKVSPKERNAGLEELEDKPSWMVENGSKTSGNQTGERYERHTTVKNPHPTLKPISLSKYLATLLLPPTEYAPRRLFVPFSGVASEMIGACLSGWENVVGVENDTKNNYVGIAEKRLEYWIKKLDGKGSE